MVARVPVPDGTPSSTSPRCAPGVRGCFSSRALPLRWRPQGQSRSPLSTIAISIAFSRPPVKFDLRGLGMAHHIVQDFLDGQEEFVPDLAVQDHGGERTGILNRHRMLELERYSSA